PHPLEINKTETLKVDKSESELKPSDKFSLSDKSSLKNEIENIEVKKSETKIEEKIETKTESKTDVNQSEVILSDREKEMEEEGEHYLEKEMEEEGEKYLEQTTPVSEVEGVGEKTEKLLKKAGIKSAEQLSMHHYKDLAKKIKIPEKSAKKIISNAKKIARIRERLKQSKLREQKGISEIVKQLENERKEIEKLKRSKQTKEEKLIELEGHADLIKVLEALEAKRKELVAMEEKLAEKEIKLAKHDETYRKELEHVENLRRRLDHDIRERTQYLINLEKEYFRKAQELNKLQADIESKEKLLNEKEEYLKEKEENLKIKSNELQDREITIETKEKKYEKIMRDLEKQDLLLKEKEEDLMKREAEYLKKLDMLETHQKAILKELEDKRRKLELQQKEIEQREKQLQIKERTIDKRGVAIEYAKTMLEQEKNKLVDDELEQYIHEQLGLLRSSGINVDDINFTNSLKIPSVGTKSIYQMIDTCKDLLKNNRIPEAKLFYNQIRDKYYEMSFTSQKEKESVHNMLRTLYDEINLAEIGRG
ncbi:MAG: hypothetical protein QW273_03900, partial [Candidatus Pacearchaeota archaeon]